MIHKDLLKQLGSKNSVGLSDKIRIRRNRLVRGVMSMFADIANFVSTKKTYTCNHTTTLPGELLLVDNNTKPSDNQDANKAHEHAEVTHRFVAEVLNRDSIDGKGLTLISSVNYDKDYNNAFWNGEQMTYGDGDGKFFAHFPNDLTVVAHELAHGITQTTCGLVYYYQSGALNESFSDVVGLTCKHWVEGQKDPKTASWLIGDSCLGTEFPGKALRSFKDEKAYSGDTQPKNMKDAKFTFSDNFGVHSLSGIPNRAFMELCLLMDEASYARPIQIKWKAHQTLSSSASFKDAAKAEYKAATELYGKEVADKVKQAYAKVGIKI